LADGLGRARGIVLSFRRGFAIRHDKIAFDAAGSER
jgi:hypothetical protein